MKEFEIPFSELSLNSELVLKETGYGETKPDPAVREIVDDLLSTAEKKVTARCCFAIREGILGEDKIIVDGVELYTGRTITDLLKNSVRFALFAATAGYGFEKMMHDIKAESDMLKIYIADIIGSLIAESAGDAMERLLEAEIRGTDHTARFSPGYCGWHLSGQKSLFALMGGSPSDIRLSDVCLMTPMKSVSGIIGIGEGVGKKFYACHICELTACYKRKEILNRKNKN